jgi:uncharacterized protein (TIGR02569 family)
MNAKDPHNDALIYEAIARSFEIEPPLVPLPGGEGRTYRAGQRIYRQESDPIEAGYIAQLYHTIQEDGFRVPKPIPTKQGGWITAEGWSAWSFVSGQPASKQDLPQVIEAVQAFHQALAQAPYPTYLRQRNSPYDRADQQAWGELPDEIDQTLAPFVRKLARRRRPVANLSPQLIHGDLNEENILVAPGLPPAIIDMTPYWRPAEFALAVLAYWLGPYRGDETVLPYFTHLPEFDQMLIRAGLRTILIRHQFSKLGRSLEGAAAFNRPISLICRWADR